jgi:3D (Asp-Asp-Asp) domain-containing protein
LDMQQEQNLARNRRARAGRIAEPVAWTLMAIGVATSAIVAKEAGTIPSMVSVHDTTIKAQPEEPQELEQVILASRTETLEVKPELTPPDEIRWFDGRPVRPVRTMWMTVTAYSPDKASCGPFADGQTATLHSVWTNAMQLVAADPSVLPYGSMITVPEYADGEIVPVLDCGAAIKGNRLDVLYPTHRRARQWGVQQIPVTIWEYADGQPATNPRKVR